jgi:serine/threonine protein kinase
MAKHEHAWPGWFDGRGPAGPGAADEEPGPPEVPGYAILGMIATGGMGCVYHARDLRLGREVALKVIRPDRLSEELLARFDLEARAVANLDHPHIVTIHHVGAFGSPGHEAPYLAMEYVPGGTLEERAGDEPMPPAEAARLVHLLARAMAHAHSRGVVHRDLKPSNVLIAPHADAAALNAAMGRPKITDFGLARREGEIGRTGPGVMVGTPAYMAPEQVECKPAGPPADVHALGAILYRLLTGRPAFDEGTWGGTVNQILKTPPRPLREVVGVMPRGLECLCLRCLSKNPEDRPTAAELADALDEWREDEDEPATAAPPAPLSRAWVLVAVAAGLAAAVVTLAAWVASRGP